MTITKKDESTYVETTENKVEFTIRDIDEKIVRLEIDLEQIQKEIDILVAKKVIAEKLVIK